MDNVEDYIIKMDPRFCSVKVLVVSSDFQDTDDNWLTSRAELVITEDGRILHSKLKNIRPPEFKDIKLENGKIIRGLIFDKPKSLKRKVVI